MSADGAGVMVAGRDPLLSVALKRSGIPPAAEVTQAELLFGALDRYRPRVLVLAPDLEGTYDLGAIAGNLTWLFPDLPVVMVRASEAPDPGQLPAGWHVFPSPPDYRRLVETVRQMLGGGDGGGSHPAATSAAPESSPSTPAGPQPLARPAAPPSAAMVAPQPAVQGLPSSLPGPTRAATGAAADAPRPPLSPRGVAATSGPVDVSWPPPSPPEPARTGSAAGAARVAASGWGWQGFPTPQVVTVCSPKGGVGKTFVAVNVAAALSSRGQEVLLLDWDLPSADVSIHLNLQGGPGMLDLLNSGREVSPEVLREHLVRHPPSALYVLKGPSRPEMAEFIGQDHLRSVLASARGSFPVVVIDTAPSPCDEALCQALESATRILLVVVQDPACLYQARVFLDLMPRLGIQRGAIGLVVNRYHEGAPDARDIHAFLGMAPVALLPDDPGACRSVMQGTPYLLRHTGPLATALFDLAQGIIPAPDAPPRAPERRRGWFLRRASHRAARL
ncbi:MAG: P-loop NTPase [Bacillota bacterium]